MSIATSAPATAPATDDAAAATTPRILVVGDTFVDVLAGPIAELPAWGHAVVSPQPIRVLPGGCALNVACSLARLRGRAALYSGIGRDAFGDIPRKHLAHLGVTLHEAHCTNNSAGGAPTGVCMAISGPADRSLVFHSGIADQFDADALSAARLAALRAAGLRHVHVSGFFSCRALRRGLPGLLRRARACGLTTSLDPNNDPTGEWARVDGLWTDVLPLLDVLLPNDLEALAMDATAPPACESGDAAEGGRERKPAAVAAAVAPANGGLDGEDEAEAKLDGAIARLAAQTGGGNVVVTTGKRGCIVREPGRPTRRVAALALANEKVLDTLGAGDAFTAAFLSRYVDGASIEEAAAFGCLNGTYCVTARGAAVNPPTEPQLLAFRAAHLGGEAAAAAALDTEAAAAAAGATPAAAAASTAVDTAGRAAPCR